MVAHAVEGPGMLNSISPPAFNEKRCLPDGTSQACSFSSCAVNRIVPDELKTSRLNSPGIGMWLTRDLLATLQMSIIAIVRAARLEGQQSALTRDAHQPGRRSLQRCNLLNARKRIQPANSALLDRKHLTRRIDP